jgi:Leucine-rich repeat (LRR) protein
MQYNDLLFYNSTVDLSTRAHAPENIKDFVVCGIKSGFLNQNFFERLTSVTYISIQESPNICFLPKSINLLTNLSFAIIRNTSITTIPEELCETISLKVLDISKNQIEVLPNSITNLTSLKTLDISSNPKFTLLQDLSSMPNLRYLLLEPKELVPLENQTSPQYNQIVANELRFYEDE